MKSAIRLFKDSLPIVTAIGVANLCNESMKHNNKRVSVDNNQRVQELHDECVKVGVASIRSEVNDIKYIAAKLTKGRFVLVRGPRGVGKTSAIYTALENIKGVITIGPVQPETDQDQLLNYVCKEITGLDGTYENNRKAMEILTQMYEEKTKRPLIVLIQASECPANEKAAALTAAARILADSFGLRVIIDCAENSCPSTLTDREVIFDFEPMSYEMMRKLPDYEKMAVEIEKQGNADLVFAVCAGRPLLLDELAQAMKIAISKGLSTDTCVRKFVMKHIGKARASIQKIIWHPGVEQVNDFYESNPVFNIVLFKVLAQFKDKSENSIAVYPENVGMSDMKDVLRNVRECILVPATGAVALQLRMGFEKRNCSFEEIKEWLNAQDASVKASLLFKE